MRNDLFAQMSQEAGNPVLYNCKLVKLVHEDGRVKGGICDYEGKLIQIERPPHHHRERRRTAATPRR